MRENNKTCLACGKTYTYCPNCRTYANHPVWMGSYCSENCKEVFNVVVNYNMKNWDADKAREEFQKLNTNTTFNNSVTKVIVEVMNTTKPKAEQKVVEPKINTVAEPVATNEATTATKPFVKRKNRKSFIAQPAKVTPVNTKIVEEEISKALDEVLKNEENTDVVTIVPEKE